MFIFKLRIWGWFLITESKDCGLNARTLFVLLFLLVSESARKRSPAIECFNKSGDLNRSQTGDTPNIFNR